MRYQPPEIKDIINLVRKGKTGKNCYGGALPTSCAIGGGFGVTCANGTSPAECAFGIAMGDCVTGSGFEPP